MGWFQLFIVLEYTHAQMVQYREQYYNLDMGNISVGGEYLPIP